MKSIFHTAITIEWNQVFIVELEFNKGKYLLNNIGSYNSSINTDDIDQLFNNPESKKIIINEFTNFLSKNKFSSKNISFGLNSSMMFVESLPIDKSLNRDQKIEHVTWELYQHFYHDESVSYASDLFITEENRELPFEQTITVSIRQDLILFFDEIAKSCGKNLHILNVDHFGAEQAFLHNYPEDAINQIMILNCDEATTDLTILIKGQPVFTTSIFNKENIVDRIIDLSKKNNLSKLFLHGRGLTSTFYELLVSKISIPVLLLDPFMKIEIPKKFTSLLQNIEERHKYTSSLGLALRMPS